MARRAGVNKSEEIRNLLSTNPAISAKEVVTTLKQRGIKISEKLFYLVRNKMSAKTTSSGNGSRSHHQGETTIQPAPALSQAETKDFVAHLSALKQAAVFLGKDQAHRIIDLL